MMLHDAAVYFDNESIYDGYTDAFLFVGQLGNFDDSTSIGATLRRRTVSLAPDLVAPVRQCVRIGNLRWISDVGISDTFQGVNIRNTYNLRVATDLFKVSTPGQAVAPVRVGVDAYGYAEFFKSLSDSRTSSDTDTYWNVFFSPSEPVQLGSILTLGTRCLRVRQTYPTPDKLVISLCDELDSDWSQTVVFTGLGAYNPVTDTEDVLSVTVKAIQLDLAKLYRWRNQAEAIAQPGDKVLIVPLTVTPKVGAIATLGLTSWRVVSFQQDLDAWELQVRQI